MAITQKQKEELLRQLESPNQQVREAAIKEVAAITGNTSLLKNISSETRGTREAVQQASEDLNLVKVEENSTQKQKEEKPNLKPQVLQQTPAEETMPVFINQENQSETATPAPHIPTIPQTHIPNNETQPQSNIKLDLSNFRGAAQNKATNLIKNQAGKKLESQGLKQMFQGGLKQGLQQGGKALMTNATAVANAAIGAASGAASAVGGAAAGIAGGVLASPVAIGAAAIGSVIIGLIIAFLIYILLVFTVAVIFFVINASGYLVPPNQYGSVQSGSGGGNIGPINQGQIISGSCPLTGSYYISSGSYNPQNETGHGSNAYWGGGNCNYSIPIPPIYPSCRYPDISIGPNNNCATINGCPFYGYAIDVNPIGGGYPSVVLPILCTPDDDCNPLSWRATGSFFICSGLSVDTPSQCTKDKWGWGTTFTSVGNGHTWKLYLAHTSKKITPGTILESGESIGNLSTDLTYNQHIHIEVSIDGEPVRPDALCQ